MKGAPNCCKAVDRKQITDLFVASLKDLENWDIFVFFSHGVGANENTVLGAMLNPSLCLNLSFFFSFHRDSNAGKCRQVSASPNSS